MLKIRIETNNDAFYGKNLANEIQHCLNDVTVKIYQGKKEFPIHDSNGNKVGSFKLTKK